MGVTVVSVSDGRSGSIACPSTSQVFCIIGQQADESKLGTMRETGDKYSTHWHVAAV
jgi:hypothetical protein